MGNLNKNLQLLLAISIAIGSFCLCSCGFNSERGDRNNSVIISIKDQKMLLIHNHHPVKTFPISSSKFGIGDRRNSNYTPLGKLTVARKIGAGAPAGAVFKGRKRTGEIIRPNAPGRDPIVSRILWLSGKERCNRNAFKRFIYIHGTPEERTIGTPRSYGCIRMKSHDVIKLSKELAVGSEIKIIKDSLTDTTMGRAYYKLPPKKSKTSKPLPHKTSSQVAKTINSKKLHNSKTS